jgi:acyl-CoA dehydrogenase
VGLLAPLSDELGATADPLVDAPELAHLRRRVKDLVDAHSPPERIAELDEAEAFDERLAEALADANILAVGGADGMGDIRHQAVVIEQLATGPTSMAVYTIVHFMLTHLIFRYGDEAQKTRWLGGLTSGTTRGAFALTEAAGGTDVLRAMTSRAHRSADGSWVLTGSKRWIGGVQRADLVIVLARTADGTMGPDDVTMFCVPGDAPGLSATVVDTMAIRGLDTNDVSFDEVRLPPDAVLGEPGMGFRQVLATLNRERINCAASAQGIARGALAVALERASERHAFGRPIGAFQVLQHRLVDGAVAIEAAASLTVRAAAVEAAGGRADVLASMAKLAASEVAVKVTSDGLQLFGGWGMDRTLPIQRYFRDARLYTFAPVTNDMARNYLGQRLLGLPRSF